MVIVFFISKDDTTKHTDTGRKKSRFLSFFTDKKRNIYMLSQLCIWFGLNSVVPFFTLFIKDYLNFSQQEAILLYFIIILASGIFAYLLLYWESVLAIQKRLVLDSYHLLLLLSWAFLPNNYLTNFSLCSLFLQALAMPRQQYFLLCFLPNSFLTTR